MMIRCAYCSRRAVVSVYVESPSGRLSVCRACRLHPHLLRALGAAARLRWPWIARLWWGLR